jgi:hypothetical protein
MALIGKALLGGVLGFVAIIALIVIGDAVGLSQGATGAVITVLIVASVVGYGWWSQTRIGRTCRALRAQLLAGHPVAYVCGLEMASTKSMISSDADELVVWDVERGELVEAVRVPRGSVQVTRQRVQTAMAKKYDGIRVDMPQGPLRLSLYSDSFWGLVFPMRGADLDVAVAALQRGAAG